MEKNKVPHKDTHGKEKNELLDFIHDSILSF